MLRRMLSSSQIIKSMSLSSNMIRTNIKENYQPARSVATGPPRGPARELPLSVHMAGGPLSPLLAPGRVTSSRQLFGVWLVLLWRRCYVERVVFHQTIWVRASTPSFKLEGLVAGVCSAAAFTSGVDGMDHGTWRWRRTCTSLPLNTSQRGFGWHWGRHQLRPVGLATVIRHVPDFLKPGTGPYGRLAWPWFLTSPLLCQR
jgi:hypothetical protein